jgi:hypothetical protein
MSLLKGKRGLNSWRWIFVRVALPFLSPRYFLSLLLFGQIIEGTTTMLLGILVFFFVTDFPDKNKFLTQKQTELVLKRIEEDRGDSVPDEVTFKKVLKHLGDWKVWVFGLMFMTQAVVCAFECVYCPYFSVTNRLASSFTASLFCWVLPFYHPRVYGLGSPRLSSPQRAPIRSCCEPLALPRS